MINLKDNGKTLYFFDKFNMALDRSDSNKFGRGDSLWRTVLFLIYSGSDELIESVSNSVRLVKGKYRYFRHPEDHDNDTSKDQSVMGHIALKMYNPELYEKVKDNLSFKCSKPIKHYWWGAWFWAKENYLLWRIQACYHFVGWWFEPAYSLHLFCWMLWHSKQKAPLIRWYLLKFIVPRWNYLLRALLNDEFTPEEIKAIEDYKTRVDFIWQRDFNEKQHPLMTEEEAEYNTLDIDVLNYVLNN